MGANNANQWEKRESSRSHLGLSFLRTCVQKKRLGEVGSEGLYDGVPPKAVDEDLTVDGVMTCEMVRSKMGVCEVKTEG